MRISQKVGAIATAVASLAGVALLDTGTATAADRPAYAIQVVADDSNLDEYDGRQIWTRDPVLSFQDWAITRLRDGSYTIRGSHYGKCIVASGPGKSVAQKSCNSGDLAQRWSLDPELRQTQIASVKYPEYVLQSHGQDTTVTLEADTSSEHDRWIFYTK